MKIKHLPGFIATATLLAATPLLALEYADTIYTGGSVLTMSDAAPRAEAIVQAVTYYDDPQKLLEISMDLGEAMEGLDVASMPEEEKMASRGW